MQKNICFILQPTKYQFLLRSKENPGKEDLNIFSCVMYAVSNTINQKLPDSKVIYANSVILNQTFFINLFWKLFLGL